MTGPDDRQPPSVAGPPQPRHAAPGVPPPTRVRESRHGRPGPEAAGPPPVSPPPQGPPGPGRARQGPPGPRPPGAFAPAPHPPGPLPGGSPRAVPPRNGPAPRGNPVPGGPVPGPPGQIRHLRPAGPPPGGAAPLRHADMPAERPRQRPPRRIAHGELVGPDERVPTGESPYAAAAPAPAQSYSDLGDRNDRPDAYAGEPGAGEEPRTTVEPVVPDSRGRRRPRRIAAAGGGGESPARGRSRAALAAALGGAVLVIAALVALSAFVWPGWVTKTLSQTSVEQGVERLLTAPVDQDGYGLEDVSEVSCPSGMKAQAGVTFTCAVKIAGENRRVTVTVLNDDGDYDVSQPGN